ncbi:EamA family transporter [Vibrio coralliilyticus]|uniref:DMT family transporter n=1 Tax=Vibrio coralliilyticus TaxID=190893 RepID=UPI000BAAE4B5|nr:DMT family transporter [Vibrio coralliilyticus]PAU37077.1 EamA family transporter [Vibrio coralliilyticus]
MPNQLYPVLFMLSSTFSLSLTGLFSKFLSEHFDANLLSFLRFILPAMVLLLMFIGKEVRWPDRNEQVPLWVRALCIGACQVCFIYALQHLTLVESVVLFGTGPLFIPVLEKLIFSVHLSVVNIVGLVTTFTGVVLLAGDVSGFNFRLELLIGLGAGVFNAGSQLSLYRISKSRLNAFEINLWTFLYAAVVITPLLALSLANNHAMYQPAGTNPWLIVAVLGVLAFLIINTQVFRSKAYKLAESGSQLAPLIFTNLLFTALWQVLFYKESYSVYQVLGLSLIIIANVACVLLPKWLKKSNLKVA